MGLVQETSGSTTGTTLTLTFSSSTTAGNGIVVAVCGYYGGTISNIKIGTTGGTFTKYATSGGINAEVWVNYSRVADLDADSDHHVHGRDSRVGLRAQRADSPGQLGGERQHGHVVGVGHR